MNERPTEPYDPADQAASTPATPATPPAAPTPVTPVRISTTGGPTAEPTAPVDAGRRSRSPPAERGLLARARPDRPRPDRLGDAGPVDPRVVVRAGRQRRDHARPQGRRAASGRWVLGPVLAASIIAATLASGGTYLTLRASGALDPAGGTATVPSGQTASAPQPVKIDESSAIIDVAAKVSPAVVRIVSTTNPNAIDPTATEGHRLRDHL